jgi:glycosyltransferase involved in cell wall biosynthesis
MGAEVAGPTGLDVLIVSGIWPPDVGGPASHGPELGRYLLGRGHRVRAVTSTGPEGAPPDPFPVTRGMPGRSKPVRLTNGALAVGRAARGADVIYATGMYTRSAMTASARSLPMVLKLVSDPAYERARSMGLFSGTLEQFQQVEKSGRLRALERARSWAVSRAARVVIPSRYLAEIAAGWGLPEGRIRVIPNPAPDVGERPDRERLRRRLGIEGPTLVFAGRLALQKNLPLMVEAFARLGRGSLVVIGDGPEMGPLRRAVAAAGVEGRVSVMGALPREQALDWMQAASATVLASSWENHPHAAVESLAVGTPVVATSVGGVPEIVEPGVNGLLVESGDVEALTHALASVLDDEALLARLRSGAERSVSGLPADDAFGEIEREISAAARG